MSRLLLPFADQHVEIPSLSAGNIALTVGLKQVQLSFISLPDFNVMCVLLGLALVYGNLMAVQIY